MTDPVQRPVALTASTLIPVGLLLCVGGAVATGAVWITNSLTQIDFRLKRIEERMSDPVTKAESAHWIEVFRIRNPDIYVPDIPSK